MYASRITIFLESVDKVKNKNKIGKPLSSPLKKPSSSLISGLSLAKTCKRGCHMPKQYFIALWHVISVKSNIAKKITGLQIMTIELRKNLACFQTYRTDVYGGVTLFTRMF